MELGLRRDKCTLFSFFFLLFLHACTATFLSIALFQFQFSFFPRFMERFSLSLVGGNVEQKVQGDRRLWDTMLEEVVVRGGDWLHLTFFCLLSPKIHIQTRIHINSSESKINL